MQCHSGKNITIKKIYKNTTYSCSRGWPLFMATHLKTPPDTLRISLHYVYHGCKVGPQLGTPLGWETQVSRTAVVIPVWIEEKKIPLHVNIQRKMKRPTKKNDAPMIYLMHIFHAFLKPFLGILNAVNNYLMHIFHAFLMVFLGILNALNNSPNWTKNKVITQIIITE